MYTDSGSTKARKVIKSRAHVYVTVTIQSHMFWGMFIIRGHSQHKPLVTINTTTCFMARAKTGSRHNYPKLTQFKTRDRVWKKYKQWVDCQWRWKLKGGRNPGETFVSSGLSTERILISASAAPDAEQNVESGGMAVGLPLRGCVELEAGMKMARRQAREAELRLRDLSLSTLADKCFHFSHSTNSTNWDYAAPVFAQQDQLIMPHSSTSFLYIGR